MPLDALYWNSIDFGSEESLANSSSVKKDYIDPWDLENYAYIRDHLDSIDFYSDNSSIDEHVPSNFYPAVPKKHPNIKRMESINSANYVAIDDDDFRREEAPVINKRKQNRNETGKIYKNCTFLSNFSNFLKILLK